MIRIKLVIAYDGSAYHGWQIQPNAVTVQGTLQAVLSEVYKESITLFGCSRTDAGVHAKNFVCHADVPFAIPLDKLPLALNAYLPDDISVLKAEEVSSDFHARFSCKGKTYQYLLWNGRIRDPFLQKRAGFHPSPLNAENMNQMAQSFVGEHDFTAFMAAGSEITDAVRTIYSFSVERSGDLIIFTVSGNGFLYNMVRIMVGTLISADQGKLDRSLPEIILSKDRTLAGITVPPQGLYLEAPFFD